MQKLTTVLLATLFIFGCSQNNLNENLLVEIDQLKIKNDSLSKLLIAKKPGSNYWYNEGYEGEVFIKNGITNPVEYIEKGLREKPELVPLKPVLGGKMQFRNIQLLSNKWLIAEYEDGHIQGKALYKYRFNNKEKLVFELLDSVDP